MCFQKLHGLWDCINISYTLHQQGVHEDYKVQPKQTKSRGSGRLRFNIFTPTIAEIQYFWQSNCKNYELIQHSNIKSNMKANVQQSWVANYLNKDCFLPKVEFSSDIILKSKEYKAKLQSLLSCAWVQCFCRVHRMSFSWRNAVSAWCWNLLFCSNLNSNGWESKIIMPP